MVLKGCDSRQPVLLQASERPMTQQGMGGLKTASSNHGRQVMDKTFFLSKLRQKRAELEAVNAQMQVHPDHQ